jgi:catechol 2,3-dioxygenase-like lactoylglutathione lyase family enzyme
MESWLTSVDVITLFVEDVQRAKTFYHDVFDLSTVYEDEHSAVVNFDNLMINLLVSTQAPDLIAPAKVATAEAGSRFQFTIRVDDVDEACAELKTRGVSLLNGPMDRPWGIRTASFTDPDGHIWEIANG